MNFEELQLIPPILKALAQLSHSSPTTVQAQAIPKALSGGNLIVSAQTGTGKTAAFVLPALQGLSTKPSVWKAGPRVLVVTPTRELADQVTQATRSYGKYLSVSSLAIFGGMPFREQMRSLSKSPDMIIATPGRLLDLMNRGRIDLSHLELFVLDEADRMLDMGFIEDVERISAAVPADCQTLLFAATVGETMTKMAQRFIKNPERIQIAPGKVTHDTIEQRLLMADNLQHKTRLLHHFCDDKALTKAIIFSATKCDADSLARDLKAKGYSAAALHGDMTQYARNRTMMNMRRGQIRLLVATDVAARGLDVRGISHIINFDLPRFAEDYVHRIGRTGRAGESGIAISFASPSDLLYINRIERYLKQNLTRHIIPGLEPAYQLTRPSNQPKNNRRGPSPKCENGANPATPRRVQRVKDSRIHVKGLGIKTQPSCPAEGRDTTKDKNREGRRLNFEPYFRTKEFSTRNPLESQASYGRGKPISINKSGPAGKPPGALPRKKSRPESTQATGPIKECAAYVRQGAIKQDGHVAVEYRRGKSGHPGRSANKKMKKMSYFGAKE